MRIFDLEALNVPCFLRSEAKFYGFEGENDDPGDNDDPGENEPKTYTQEEFDTHMAGVRRKYEQREEKHKQAQKELAAQLEKQKKSKGLSDEERTALQTRIDELENEFLSEKEKAERAAKAEREQYASQIDSLTGQTKHWRSSYEREVLKNGLRAAASEHKAYDRSGDQIAAILGPMVEFKDVLDDDDQPTGDVKPVIRFPDVDSKTKDSITMEYTIGEAVKRMTELDKYANLFEDTMRGGLGGGKNGGKPAGKIDVRKLAKENPAEYRRLRKERPDLIAAALKGN